MIKIAQTDIEYTFKCSGNQFDVHYQIHLADIVRKSIRLMLFCCLPNLEQNW